MILSGLKACHNGGGYHTANAHTVLLVSLSMHSLPDTVPSIVCAVGAKTTVVIPIAFLYLYAWTTREGLLLSQGLLLH